MLRFFISSKPPIFYRPTYIILISSPNTVYANLHLIAGLAVGDILLIVVHK